MGRERALHHAITALGIGHLLAADPADPSTHIVVDLSPNERHRAQIVHSRPHEEARLARGSGLEKAVDFLGRMLAIGIEQDDKLYLRLRQPATQSGLYRLTFPAILWMDDDFGATFSRARGGGIGRAIVHHEDMIELGASALRDLSHVHLFVISGNNGGNVPAVEQPA